MSVLTVFVSSDSNVASERRFDKGLKLSALKGRLEPIVGIKAENQQLSLYHGEKLVANLSGAALASTDDAVMLGAFPIEDYMRIHVVNTGPGRRDEFSDLSQVEKYEMPDDEYEKRNDSVRAFKIRNKLGRFADSASVQSDKSAYADPPDGIKIGARFEAEVDGMKRRGSVKFIGPTKFKPGFWIGVEYDEPLGKHNGTVDGESYFTCRSKHGAFLRPDKLKIGDYPEEDIFMSDDDLEEM